MVETKPDKIPTIYTISHRADSIRRRPMMSSRRRDSLTAPCTCSITIARRTSFSRPLEQIWSTSCRTLSRRSASHQCRFLATRRSMNRASRERYGPSSANAARRCSSRRSTAITRGRSPNGSATMMTNHFNKRRERKNSRHLLGTVSMKTMIATRAAWTTTRLEMKRQASIIRPRRRASLTLLSAADRAGS